MRAPKLLSGLLLIGLAVWFLVSVFVSDETVAPPTRFTSSASCRDCHPAVFGEWERSQHAQSWTNPAVRALSNDFANTDCIDCHAPRPVFETGIGNRVLPRASRRVEGVDCIACHQVPAVLGAGSSVGGVRMAGTVENMGVACRPVQRRELTRPEFCAGCHDQHKTVQQWRESEWPDRGKDCLDCHMPESATSRGAGRRPGRSHTFHGGDSLAMLQKAVELRGVREDGRWVIEVENVGAGHSFPTDERSRAADVFWRPLLASEDAGATELPSWRHLHRFRSPYRHEADIPDTLLAAHENRRIPLEDPEGAGAVEVALFYKRSPYFADPAAPDPEREAVLVHRVELVP